MRLQILSLLASITVSLFASVTAAPTANPISPPRHRTTKGFDVVAHDTIRPIPDNINNDDVGDAMRRFEPYLHISHGCQPYPAVSAFGQVGAGLKNTGAPAGGCSERDNGQTYVRAGWYGHRFAIMYAWYWPKNQIIAGGGNFGHKHEWEHVIIWTDTREYHHCLTKLLSKADSTLFAAAYNLAGPTVIGGVVSKFGEYKITRKPPMRDNTHPQVQYFTNFPRNHELQFLESPGTTYPMIDYELVSPEVKKAFDGYDWGKGHCPFNERNWEYNLQRAWIDAPDPAAEALAAKIHYYETHPQSSKMP